MRLCSLFNNSILGTLAALKKSLHIRDSLNNKGGVVVSKIYLAQYYTYKQDTAIAISYALEANVLAKEIKNGSDYLESLSLLAKLDSNNSVKYLNLFAIKGDINESVHHKSKEVNCIYEIKGS